MRCDPAALWPAQQTLHAEVEIPSPPFPRAATDECQFPPQGDHDAWRTSMRVSLFASVCAPGLLALSLGSGSVAQTPDTKGLSGPLVHENLAVYFIHGNSVPGKVPLSLEEALASGVVKVR